MSSIAGRTRSAIVGIAGTVLGAEEAALFRRCPPAGVILFGRNVQDAAQLSALTSDLRAVLPEGAAIAVDQEGGRVARLRPPTWLEHPAAARLGDLYDADQAAGLRAAWLTGALIGLDCAGAGFDLVCAPVLDLRHPGMHSVVGDRAFSADAGTVAALGRAVAEGLLAGGTVPVAKHAPGHGWAEVDSHAALPFVRAGADLDTDLRPFAACADLPWMMTAHLLYAEWDADQPGTLSPTVLQSVVRQRIGFDGVLVSDDLAMGALSGSPAQRAAAALAAGCDLALFCPGDLADNRVVLDACPPLRPATERRLARARDMLTAGRQVLDRPALIGERAGLLR